MNVVGQSVSVASSSTPYPLADNDTLTSGKPSGFCSGKSPASNPDPRRYRSLYPDKWHGFLHAHFRDAMHVAYSFGVSERSARDWWEGVSTSQGWAVAYAIENIPGAAEHLRAA
jgi:hypothetical protein